MHTGTRTSHTRDFSVFSKRGTKQQRAQCAYIELEGGRDFSVILIKCVQHWRELVVPHKYELGAVVVCECMTTTSNASGHT